MSSYIRTIRGIERSPGYLSVHSINRYGAYPYRGGEPRLPPPAYKDWHEPVQEAARSAAHWLQIVQQAQAAIDRLTAFYSKRILTQNDVKEGVRLVAGMINDLYAAHKQHAAQLKPELWESIELALRHPALRKLGLTRTDSETLCIELQSSFAKAYASSCESEDKPLTSELQQEIKRLLLGADGWLNALRHALAYSDRDKASELLRQGWLASLPHIPYIAYYSSMQTYSPIPMSGMLLNRSV